MKNSRFAAAVVLAVLVIGSKPSFATESKAPKPENAMGVSGHPTTPPKKPEANNKTTKKIKPVDINKASKAQLKTIPGISDVEAEKIIAGRPYLTKTDLVNKKVLPTGPYLSLKRYVVAMRHGPLPKPAKPAASAPQSKA